MMLREFARGVGREFANKCPGNFGGLAVVVMDKEAVTEFVLEFNGLHGSCWGDLVGLADGGVGFEEADAVFEVHIEGVFPLEEADIAQTHAFCRPEGNFEWVLCFRFHRRPSFLRPSIISNLTSPTEGLKGR